MDFQLNSLSLKEKLRVMSWNSNGLKNKKEIVKLEIKKQNCDVVFLQQTRSGESELPEELEGYKSFYTTQTSNTTGVAILIKTNIFEEETGCTIEKDPTGCYILVKCFLNGHLFTLMSVYNCHTDSRPFLKLRSVLEKHAEGFLLIGGDFNVALNPYVDRTSKTKNNSHSLFRAIVGEFMTSFHLVDVWRRLHPTDRHYTYHQTSIKSRLDYIFVPEESVQYIETCNIFQDESCSDHYPVVSEIIMPKEEHKRPRGVLKSSNKSSTNRVSIVEVQETVVDTWLRVKRAHPDLRINPHKRLMISAGEVERAIQSLVLNNVKRPDGLSVFFYKSNSHVLIPHLCAFYHNVLEEPADISEAFSASSKASETHRIFNVDYLILATIMSRWLYDHLQSHSVNYTIGENKNTVFFTLKKKLLAVRWSVLQRLLNKEQDNERTNPPLLEKFKIAVLHKILTNSPSGKRKLLYWGCPLTPVLMLLYLKNAALTMVKMVRDKNASIHISRQDVIVRFSTEFDMSLLQQLKEKYNLCDCTTLE